MQIDENVVLGLEIGIDSIGWTLVREDPKTLEKHIVSRTQADGEILYALGARIFRVPEHPKTKELLNVQRRAARQQRRVIQKRAQRMRRVRRLLSRSGMPVALDMQALHLRKGFQHDPWALRKEALERLLLPEELAVVLLHLAKHRGFKSSRKRDGSGEDVETGKMLSGLNSLKEKVQATGGTIGEFLFKQHRKRNFKDALGQVTYGNTVAQSLVEDETDIIFAKQQGFGSTLATDALRDEYKQLAFTQRPLTSLADKIGECCIFKGEKRAPTFAPTAERFRLAQCLTQIRLQNDKGENIPLSEEQINAVLAMQGTHAKITYKTIRKALNLPPAVVFEGLSQSPRAESADVVRNTKSCLEGSAKLAECLGLEGYKRLYERRLADQESAPGMRCLDYVAKVISENDDLSFIESCLSALDLEEQDLESLLQGLETGAFAMFKGTNRLSLKAMALVLPSMIACGDYNKALAELGLKEQEEVDFNNLHNPILQCIMREVRKQTSAVLRDWNLLPGRVHIGLQHGVGKSPDQRNKFEKAAKGKATLGTLARKAAAEAFGIAENDVSSMEVQRYVLWQTQEGMCAYYRLWRHLGGERHYQDAMPDGRIPVQWLRDGENAVQIDHILPQSRTMDTSFNNLCLCCASAKQDKAGRTPYEWLGQISADSWQEYKDWVQSLNIKGLKKRNFLLQNLDTSTENKLQSYNLTESRYAARLISRWFVEQYAQWAASRGEVPAARVFTRSSVITKFLASQWGMQRLMMLDRGNVLEDGRKHALDALMVACCTEGQLQRIVTLMQKSDTEHICLQIPVPGEGFIQEIQEAYAQVLVSRKEHRQKTGALHENTLHSIKTESNQDGTQKEVLYKRTFITDISLKDLDRIKDPHRCPDIVEALRKWLSLPKNEQCEERNLPRSARGDVIRHVNLRYGDFNSGVRLKRGNGFAHAHNGNIVRVDVYTKDGKFYLVPLYIKQLAAGELPMRAIVPYKANDEWLLMDETYAFCFSIFKDSYLRIQKDIMETAGYYFSTDRRTGAINLTHANSRAIFMRGLGVRMLTCFEKYTVDRLGRLTKVHGEPDPRRFREKT